jgi:predicted AAA+ superfamily ATPase
LVKSVASGSAAAALRLKSAESGAGRFTDFLLPPLTFHEYTELLGKTALVEVEKAPAGYVKHVAAPDPDALNEHFLNYLNFGGYPEVAFSKDIQKDPSRFIKNDIIDKVLLRDLPSLYGIQDVQELNYLFTTLAYNTANEISLDELSKGSGVAKNTIKRYVEYLEAAFLVRTVHRVDRSAKRFERANFFKIYLTNPSMRAALFSPVAMDDEPMGALVETAIFSQWFHARTPLHYARWHNGEVDIVCLGPKQKAAWAIEVKWSDRYLGRPQELPSLLRFAHAQNLTRAMVTSRTTRGERTIESVTFEFLPASLYCYMLGFNVVHGRYVLEGLTQEKPPEEERTSA